MENKTDVGVSDTEQDYRAELKRHGVIAFVPGGNSMWPTLKSHKQSVIVKVKSAKLEKYDVALYLRKDGTNVLHRVMNPTEDGYIMCGDSQFQTEKVAEDQVYGVMEGFYRGKRYIDVKDPDYIDEVNKWFSRRLLRKIRLKLFYARINFISRLKGVIRKIFGKGKKDV